MSLLQEALINLYKSLYGSKTDAYSVPSTTSYAHDSSVLDTKSSVLDAALIATALTSNRNSQPVTIVNNVVGNNSGSGSGSGIGSTTSGGGSDDKEESKKPPSLVGPIFSVLLLVPTGAYCISQIVKTKRMIDDINNMVNDHDDSRLKRKWKDWRREYAIYQLGCNRSFLGFGLTSLLGLGNYLLLFRHPMVQYYFNVLLLCLGGSSLGYFCLIYFLRDIQSEKRKFDAVLSAIKEKSE